MRITSGMYYSGIYGSNNSKLSEKLFDVNRQIASRQQFQYGHQNVIGFSDTMRLDNEINILGQIKKSTENGYKISNQTDIVLKDFQTSLDRTKTLLVQAANASNSDVSLDAIAVELRGLEKHFKNLANTSINGQYLFSGSAIDIKPIAQDGTYKGNSAVLEAVLDSNVKQQYNLSGSQLFLGENLADNKLITSNVINKNQTAQYPKFDGDTTFGTEKYLTVEDTIRDLMGDTDEEIDAGNPKHHFYLSGTTSDGTTFRKTLKMSDEDSVEELLKQIGNEYGNTPDVKVVNVSLNNYGEIVVEDKMKGSSKLDFHMVGATDFRFTNATDYDAALLGNAADIEDAVYYGVPGRIENLDGATTKFMDVMGSTYTPGLFVKEFVKSDFKPEEGSTLTTDGLLYDKTQFAQKGSKLTSNVAQVVQSTNAFATDKTKLSEVVAGPLDGTTFVLNGKNIQGTDLDVEINFFNGGSTFTVNNPLPGGTYDIFNMQSPRVAVAADDMTYRQFMDVINMAMTGKLPTGNTAADYDTAVEDAKSLGGVNLSYDGKIEFEDKDSSTTKANISLYDSRSELFSDTNAPILSFNSNNALTVSDPKTDFFKSLDSIITAVEDYKLYPDGSHGTTRNIGMQNAIALLDDLQDHISRTHAQVGAQSNALTRAIERTTLLNVSTMSLRSSVIDTDIAEATLTLNHLSLNYQAMLSTVGKVSKLSLVNYL
ncbi:MAG: flagellar biosynthesis protein FlgL [Sulfurimonadaceae bacterium]|jgi:flagellar hook-associated protein 3 FlgL|nr:flagellar biosynthesis protein FlgL [Sulfurimonadaceae bacterium]